MTGETKRGAARRLAPALALLLLPIGASAAPPARRLAVYPAEVSLAGARDHQAVVVQLTEPDGLTRDVTAEATLTPADTALVGIDAHTALQPLADGDTTIRVAFDELEATLPVSVRGAGQRRPPSFRLDVLPVLTSAGCNNGACHGSARGQDGFHLSLFGFDPAGDYRALTTELPGRRVNLARPDESLVLTKAVGAVPHTGGQLLERRDPRYDAVLEWLRGSAPADPPDTPQVTDVELYPPEMVLTAGGAPHRLAVRARYADGTTRDVTALAALLTSNEVSARLADGRVVPGQRGEAQVMARFGPLTVGVPVIVVPADAASDYAAPPAVNYIDQHVDDKLRRLRIEPSGLCDDAVFLRRVYLDVVGVLPTPEEQERFLADGRPDRRARLVEELLGRKEFVELWVMKWAERLQIRSTPEFSYKSMLLYYQWLQQRIAAGDPLGEIFRDLLAASGGAFSNPAVNFYELEKDTLKLSENVAQAFLGLRLQCAQCHNHPFDRWTMDDYYGFAAFFSQVGRKKGEDPREAVVFNSGGGEVQHPVGNAPVTPKLLGGPAPDLAGRDRRAVLADWLTAPDNPWFARNVANFVWAHFFHRGIIDPVDDARVSNPPSNPALLDALAARLVETDFDLRALVRDICNSRTYQLATQTNDTNADDRSNFSHAIVRRIRAEVLLDAISQVSGAPDKFRGLPLGARAVQVADGATTNYFLDTFGRARRESVCTCEVVMEPSLSQALHLINGETVHRKITQGNRVRSWLAEGAPPERIVERLYRTCLVRPPTEAEAAAVATELSAEGADPAVVLEDLFWALLNSKEFLFNH